ncbi:MAG: HAD family hydrolase [Clostridiaceae bacterium]|nr:HAD family hydrolase [Eubacteriales bacterium]
MKRYRAIFFDWDGTAVISRSAPADAVAAAMAPLLTKGIYLFIISGTTYPNIAGGQLERYFPPAQLRYLFLGLARGSHNLGFDQNGRPTHTFDPQVSKDILLRIHQTAFDVHQELLRDYDYPTDIIFDRPNYVKVDLMPGNDRDANLFLSGDELGAVKRALARHGYHAGLAGLTELALNCGARHGLAVRPTCDAKYLEIGVLNKADNVDAFMERVLAPAGIAAEECCFWGDEFLELDCGLNGSDSFMHTPLTQGADFFDVGTVAGERPTHLTHLGGSVETFLRFLKAQAAL